MKRLLKASGVQTLTGFLFVSLVLCPATVFGTLWPGVPPVVRAWRLSGTRAISQDTVLSWISMKPGVMWSAQAYRADLQRIRSGYADEGFFEASIESDTAIWSRDSSTVDIVVVLNEGRQATIGELRFEGSSAFEEAEIQSVSGLSQGDPFRVSAIEEGIHNILHSYERKGFPLAQASVAEIAIGRGEGELVARLTIQIEEGRKALVKEVRLSGNERTREEVVLRELRLGAGRPFDPELPSDVQRKLERLDIFSSVSEPEFYVLGGGDLGLALTVKEGNTNRFDGAVGYIPPSPDGRAGYVTGLLDLGFRNLFGTGRRLDAHWRRIDRLSQDLALRYKEPWLFGLPVSVTGGFAQRKQDSSYVQRSFDANAELMVTEEFSIGAGITTVSVVPGQLERPSVTENGWTGFALVLLYDSRDRSLAPTSGALYQTSYERGSKRIEAGPLAPEAVTDTKERISADVEAYFTIARPHMIAAFAHAREIRTALLDVSDLFRVGGARTLRGYAEDQFLGSRVVWTNLEYRLLAGGRSYLYAFLDWAYVATVSAEGSLLPASEVRPYGYGAGLFVETALGFVDVSIAAGKDDTFSTAKLHLRLINEF